MRRNQRLSSCGASSARGEHHSRPRALVPSCRALQACCATGLPGLENCGASACVRTAIRWSFFRRTVPVCGRGAHAHGFGFYERFGEQGSTARASAQSRAPSAGRKRSPENCPGAVGVLKHCHHHGRLLARHAEHASGGGRQGRRCAEGGAKERFVNRSDSNRAASPLPGRPAHREKLQ